MCTNNVNKYKYFSFSTSGWAPPLMVPTLTSGKFICKFCKKNVSIKWKFKTKHGTFFHTLLQCLHVPVSCKWLSPVSPTGQLYFLNS